MNEKPIDPFLFHVLNNEELCTDGKPHDWKGWVELEGGLGGTTVCSRCGLYAITHSLRYGP